MAEALVYLPMAMQVGSTLMGMSAQDKAADAAEQNAAFARAAGDLEADLSLQNADLEAGLSMQSADLESGYAKLGSSLEAGYVKQGGALEAYYARRSASRKRAAADFEANQLEQQAGQQVAAAQRDVLDVQRVGRLAQSRAIALAAASGGGASSAPTVINIIGNLAKESAYNAGRALYAGEERARLMRLQASAKRMEGDFALEAGEEGATVADFRANTSATLSKFRGDTTASLALFRGSAGAASARMRGASGAASARMRGSAGGASGDASAEGYRTQKIGTLISGAGSLYGKYGGVNGPRTVNLGSESAWAGDYYAS